MTQVCTSTSANAQKAIVASVAFAQCGSMHRCLAMHTAFSHPKHVCAPLFAAFINSQYTYHSIVKHQT